MFRKARQSGYGFFSGIVPHEVRVDPEGGRHFSLEVPQRYFQWNLMIAHFPASATAVRKLLPGDSLEPILAAPGVAVVSMGAFDYLRPATLARYKEFALMVPVRYRPGINVPTVPLIFPDWFRDLGFYIFHLPVTTTEARDAGIHIWNYPKTVADLTFSETANGFRRCHWRGPTGRDVVILEVRKSRTARKLQNFLTFSVAEDGRLRQTLVRTQGWYDETHLGFDASFWLGEDQVSEQVRQLGVRNVPLGRLYGDRLQGVLYGPDAAPPSSVEEPAPARRDRSDLTKVHWSNSSALRRATRERVAILGGGVAGLSAAHELVERGFKVTVYEKSRTAGGKARSGTMLETGKAGRKDLPTEHGFRFFPGFYRHLPDTMGRIPYGASGRTVLDNLVEARRIEASFTGDRRLVAPARFPHSLEDLGEILESVGFFKVRVGCTTDDVAFYLERVWQLLTSCRERRLEEYERLSWWEYVDADGRSPAYQQHLASTTRMLVAADPKTSSARTVGNALTQLLFNLVAPGVGADRVLNGPTSEVWINPWIQYLSDNGVEFKFGHTVRRIDCDGEVIAGVDIDGTTIKADYYIAALPIEVIAPLVTDAMIDIDSGLKGLRALQHDTEWMTGVQFYLADDIWLGQGHQMHLDSPWALTSLSQAQFWKPGIDLARDYGDGKVKGIISVDISDWSREGLNGKRARDCSRKEIIEEVWQQLQQSLYELDGIRYLRAHLDEAIRFEHGVAVANGEPLLVNKKNRWHLRPDASSWIPNLFMAADYVRTYTDLATMEGANEAARRAVNAILDVARPRVEHCTIWDLREPLALAGWHWIDRRRYYRGMKWQNDFPFGLHGLPLLLNIAGRAAEFPDRVARITSEEGESLSESAQEQISAIVLATRDALQQTDEEALKSLFARDGRVRIGGGSLDLVQFTALLRELRTDRGLGEIDIIDLAGCLWLDEERVEVSVDVEVRWPRAPGGRPPDLGRASLVVSRESRGRSPWLIRLLMYRPVEVP